MDIIRRTNIFIGKGDKMKIERTMIKRKIVLIWTCNNPNHEHKTERSANYCIEKERNSAIKKGKV